MLDQNTDILHVSEKHVRKINERNLSGGGGVGGIISSSKHGLGSPLKTNIRNAHTHQSQVYNVL